MTDRISEIRRLNMNIQRQKGAFVNKQKGILKFVKSQTKKTDIIHNQILDELLDTNFYHHIYNKYILDEHFDVNDIPVKELDLLVYFDFCNPDELKDKYKGFTIKQLPLY
jgi:hypothetical protein